MTDAKKVVINPCASLLLEVPRLPERRLCSVGTCTAEGRSARMFSAVPVLFALP
jgi:hypothetical protein